MPEATWARCRFEKAAGCSGLSNTSTGTSVAQAATATPPLTGSSLGFFSPMFLSWIPGPELPQTSTSKWKASHGLKLPICTGAGTPEQRAVFTSSGQELNPLC